MADTRRYMFHGHSAALGGRIVRAGDGKDAKLIKDGFVDVPASALTVAGGRSTARFGGDQLTSPAARAVVRFKNATAFSEGIFDDLKGHFAATLGERAFDTLTATTKVRAEVIGLEVGREAGIRMQVRGVRAGFTSQSASASGETPVQLDEDSGFDGKTVTFVDAAGKSYTLVVEVQRGVFTEHDTYTKLTVAASTAKFIRAFGHTLHLDTAQAQSTAPALIRSDGGAVQGTIVKPLQWKGPAFPGSTFIDGRPNAVHIPGLGRIFFGEISKPTAQN